MGRYNANERKPLTKTFLEGQKKQTMLATFKPDTVEQYWKDMIPIHGKALIKEMRAVSNKVEYDLFVRKNLSN